jgi:hypothetical protein
LPDIGGATDVKAYTIDDLVKAGPFGRSSLYKAIGEKRLVARKEGRKTVILESDWEAYLKALPVLDTSKDSQAAA